MSTDIVTIVGIVLNTVSALALLVTVLIMAFQIKEMRRATYATAFKAIYDMLQTDDVRNARRIVLRTLASKLLDSWTDEEKRITERFVPVTIRRLLWFGTVWFLLMLLLTVGVIPYVALGTSYHRW